MKYFVLLVLVAVCQGVVLRGSPRSQQASERIQKYVSKLEQSGESPEKPYVGFKKQKQIVPLDKTNQIKELAANRELGKQYPIKQSILGQNLEKSPIDVGKQWTKLPLQLIPKNTPFIQYTRPQTFQDYVKSFSNGEHWIPVKSVYPDVLDFQTFRDLIQFPGGDFLENEIDKCLWNTRDQKLPLYWPTEEFKAKNPFDTDMEMDLTKVQGVRDVLPNIVTKLEKMVPLYMQVTNDPSTIAMLVTRDLIKIVLHERMECPTTTWDKYFIENIKGQLNKVTDDEKHQLLESFKTLLPEVVPEFPDMIDNLLYTIVQDIQLHVYKDVMQYAHGVAFKDVAIMSRKLYHELERVFEDSWQQDVTTVMEQLVVVVTEIVTSCGTCPREQKLYRSTLVCLDFDKLFMERELANIHSRVMNIVYHFLHRTCTGEDCMQQYPRVTEAFKTIIGRFISTIVQRVPMCRTPECLDPTECLIRYPFQGPSRVERIKTRIPLWNVPNKIEKSRYL